MPIDLADVSAFECRRLRASDGLSVRALPGGCIYEIERQGILINQILASPLAGGVHRLYLRLHEGEEIRFIEVIGPRAASTFATSGDRFAWSGAWEGIHYRCTCWLHPTGGVWFFHLEVENRAGEDVRCDAVMVQDLGLAARGQVRNNELFTSQYLDHSAVEHTELGYVLMTRQNLPQQGNTHPWLLQGCFPRARGFTTDGFDFFGIGFRDHGSPAALSRPIIGTQVRQYETGHTSIQSSDVELPPARSHAWTFFAHFLADHPEASSRSDLARVKAVVVMHDDMLLALREPATAVATNAPRSVFQTCDLFRADELDARDIDTLLPGDRRHEETDGGRLRSFFRGPDAWHVVLKAKELSVERPHGSILRAGRGFMPDDELMSCTCCAAGVFASQLALGNASLGKLTSPARDPLNIVRSGGLRILVRDDASRPWQLLAVPSAFEMALDECRWIYKRGADLITVTCSASETEPAIAFDVRVEGPRPLEMLVCGEIAGGSEEYESRPRMSVDAGQSRITIGPDPRSLLGEKMPGIAFHVEVTTTDPLDAIGGDELLFEDAESRRLPYFAMRTRAAKAFSFRIHGTLGETKRAPALLASTEHRFEPRVRITGIDGAQQVADTLAWFARDAMVHLSTPRGLEQRNGGAWGVRDVCQGPVEFLLSYDRADVVASIVRRLFAQQYDGRFDWPQWFMFPPFERIQAQDSHGDVIIWPLKALCDYLEHSNDGSILHERLPYTDASAFKPTDRRETILEHCDRLIGRMREQFLPGVALPRYGDGDWDDSLQPADAELRERMVSAWTAELTYQTLRRYATALKHFGEDARATSLNRMADDIETDFQRHLMPDGVVAGFAVFGESSRATEYLLHPSDTLTGLRYRLIPMTRGILSGIFSQRQAEQHLDLIREHLLFPDGARLMDRPTAYRGGVEQTFRRSESAAFFGREIGLQYVHAHLRYAEALAMMGRAEELWRALLVVNPIAVTDLVPNARPRQRNCYFSSSDAAFRDRYEASREYDRLRRGEVPVDGGWRIYSSGPGIYTSLVLRHALGLRRYFDSIEFDPVLPQAATCELELDRRRVRYEPRASGVAATVLANGTSLGATRSSNPYRVGAIRVSKTELTGLLRTGENAIALK